MAYMRRHIMRSPTWAEKVILGLMPWATGISAMAGVSVLGKTPHALHTMFTDWEMHETRLAHICGGAGIGTLVFGLFNWKTPEVFGRLATDEEINNPDKRQPKDPNKPNDRPKLLPQKTRSSWPRTFANTTAGVLGAGVIMGVEEAGFPGMLTLFAMSCLFILAHQTRHLEKKAVPVEPDDLPDPDSIERSQPPVTSCLRHIPLFTNARHFAGELVNLVYSLRGKPREFDSVKITRARPTGRGLPPGVEQELIVLTTPTASASQLQVALAKLQSLTPAEPPGAPTPKMRRLDYIESYLSSRGTSEAHQAAAYAVILLNMNRASPPGQAVVGDEMREFASEWLEDRRRNNRPQFADSEFSSDHQAAYITQAGYPDLILRLPRSRSNTLVPPPPLDAVPLTQIRSDASPITDSMRRQVHKQLNELARPEADRMSNALWTLEGLLGSIDVDITDLAQIASHLDLPAYVMAGGASEPQQALRHAALVRNIVTAWPGDGRPLIAHAICEFADTWFRRTNPNLYVDDFNRAEADTVTAAFGDVILHAPRPRANTRSRASTISSPARSSSSASSSSSVSASSSGSSSASSSSTSVTVRPEVGVAMTALARTNSGGDTEAHMQAVGAAILSLQTLVSEDELESDLRKFVSRDKLPMAVIALQYAQMLLNMRALTESSGTELGFAMRIRESVTKALQQFPEVPALDLDDAQRQILIDAGFARLLVTRHTFVNDNSDGRNFIEINDAGIRIVVPGEPPNDSSSFEIGVEHLAALRSQLIKVTSDASYETVNPSQLFLKITQTFRPDDLIQFLRDAHLIGIPGKTVDPADHTYG
jgi:hypothetical protein